MSKTDTEPSPKNLIEARIGENGYQVVSIAAFQLEKPYDFGRFIADVAPHGAKAYATTFDLDEDEVMQQICEGLTEQLRWQDSTIEMINPGSLDS